MEQEETGEVMEDRAIEVVGKEVREAKGMVVEEKGMVE